MPQLKAAKKALRVSARQRRVNDRWRQRVRTSVRAVRDAIVARDKPTAAQTFQAAQQQIDRAARRNVMHPNTAARKKSRLQKMIAGL